MCAACGIAENGKIRSTLAKCETTPNEWLYVSRGTRCCQRNIPSWRHWWQRWHGGSQHRRRCRRQVDKIYLICFHAICPKIHIYFHIILDFTVITLFVSKTENLLPSAFLANDPVVLPRLHGTRCRVSEVEGERKSYYDTYAHFGWCRFTRTSRLRIHLANVSQQI